MEFAKKTWELELISPDEQLISHPKNEPFWLIVHLLQALFNDLNH